MISCLTIIEINSIKCPEIWRNNNTHFQLDTRSSFTVAVSCVYWHHSNKTRWLGGYNYNKMNIFYRDLNVIHVSKWCRSKNILIPVSKKHELMLWQVCRQTAEKHLLKCVCSKWRLAKLTQYMLRPSTLTTTAYTDINKAATVFSMTQAVCGLYLFHF